MAHVSVFCGSRSGNSPEFEQHAREVALGLVRDGHSIVYGGGSQGIMGAVADVALQHNASIVGVIPECLAQVELMHADVADMRVVSDMHARKQLMHQLSDVCLVLPGGYGTMEEAFEAITWTQLRIHRKPVAFLSSCNCYQALQQLCDDMLAHGFISPACRSLTHFCSTPQQLLDWLQTIVREPDPPPGH